MVAALEAKELLLLHQVGWHYKHSTHARFSPT